MADAGAGSSDGKMVKIKPQDKSLGFDGNNVDRFLSDYQLAARLDGASDSDMAQQVRFFVRGEEVKDVLETLDGFETKECRCPHQLVGGDSNIVLLLVFDGGAREDLGSAYQRQDNDHDKAVDEVMKGQPALTFEDSRSSNPVSTSLFKQSNEIMNKMETDRRPKEAPVSAKAPATIDEISKMLQSFEQRLEKKFLASAAPPSSSVPPAP
ncbi:uncharacterized protein PGTG_02498 [Puccinia graminis f. sp. tritici CRL 75-36-700-3]|uniref:Uncharacterized protein n=2 Tax=Puccinia graminis f. sp. tritici TaxID=56615 RepID=E3JVI2_PUCGT|nr:uncharacterized protein PGTG_02498 [Puccinia graminis f. sp. tritici CRL 75-36-700-3]EFP76057.1 hypothetical protein PGTG_02498 [Puccinia graminis f. sp. tritici CRL 75-36-700-3]